MAKKIKKVAVVRCVGGSPLKEGIDRAALPQDCGAIKDQYPEGISLCVYGCLGGGSCVKACRKDAVHLTEGGTALVDEETCIGCGLCAKACPQGIITIVPKEATIRPKCSNKDAAKAARAVCKNACIGCRICEKNCPADAIHVIENHAVIDTGKCIACAMCAVKCPRGVIHDVFGILADK